MGKQSAVLLPAEEYTDPTGSPKWIPDDDDFDGFDDGSQFVAENERKSKKNKGAKQKKQPKASKQPKEEGENVHSVLKRIDLTNLLPSSNVHRQRRRGDRRPGVWRAI